MIKVSVVIPVYGVERYIGRCVDTLMRQTLDEVEYIFVDDCTPDHSFDVVEDMIAKYPERREQITILHHEVNRGLPAARNTGMAAATGEYIFHCDSDDFVEPTLLEDMYRAAKEHDADYVWCDWFLSYNNTDREMIQPSSNSPQDTLKGLLCDAMKYNVWNKLVKRSLYVGNEIVFPSGHSMGEDMTMIRLAACATKVTHVPKALYHYVKTNAGAMTQNMSQKALDDILYNVETTLTFLHNHISYDIDKECAFFKLNVKLPFLITDDVKQYVIWKAWFREANSFIWRNHRIAFRTRLLQWMASKDQWWYVRVYYRIVYGLIYKILFR